MGKKIGINLFASVFAFIVNLSINFILSPFIINNLGTEAYGFVNLANNIASYASLLTIALNSLASRFIAISYHKKKFIPATEYFNSVLYSNIFLGTIILVIFIIVVAFLESIVNIPDSMIFNVKILFLLTFVNTVLSLINSTYSVATFIKNRLDLSSLRTLESSFLKGIVLFLLFTFLSPNVIYLGIAILVSTIFVFITNYYYTKKLIPEIKIGLHYFKLKKAYELVSAGIWNVITNVGQLLIGGLDLLISNIFIGAVAMGRLSIAQILLVQFSSFMSTLSSVFYPKVIEIYAKENNEQTARQLIFNMKVSGTFSNTCITCIIVWGELFFKLWVPSEDSFFLWQLTVILIGGSLISGVVYPLYNVYPLTNKIKISAFEQLFSGCLNILIVMILLKFTSMGLYAIAGISACIAFVRDLLFTPLYSSYCLRTSPRTFYSIMFKYLYATIVIMVFQLFFKRFLQFQGNNWWVFIIGCLLGVLISSIINILVLFNQIERKKIFDTIHKKIKMN